MRNLKADFYWGPQGTGNLLLALTQAPLQGAQGTMWVGYRGLNSGEALYKVPSCGATNPEKPKFSKSKCTKTFTMSSFPSF